MRWSTVLVALLVTLTGQLIQATHFTRDESSEDSKTEFNLVSLLKGGISKNRHHAYAKLDSEQYPELTQQPIRQPSGAYATTTIDDVSAHECGGCGSAASRLNSGAVVVNPAGNQIPQQPTLSGYPQPAGYPYAPIAGQAQQAAGAYSSGSATQHQASSSAAQAQNPGYVPIYPQLPGQQPAYGPPGYAYPGQYLPQYPSYPGYPAYNPGNVPVVTHPGTAPQPPPPTSYQNQQLYSPQDRWDHSFSVNTQYQEDGVHKGPFGVLNNHNGQGYGSGYGGGYNGAFNRPGY